jgi:multimeric flavodoxin WrbA
MKVVAFNGSPRVKGNTSILICKVFEELNKDGIDTVEINVGAKQVKGCVDCLRCYKNKNNKCAIESDGFNEYLSAMLDAGGIVLGSPVYFADVSGQMKNFIDRLGRVSHANKLLVRKVGASVVSVRRGGALHAYHTLNSVFGICEAITVGSSYWNFAFGNDKGDVLTDKEGLQTMSTLGKNMAWLLKSIHHHNDKNCKH